MLIPQQYAPRHMLARYAPSFSSGVRVGRRRPPCCCTMAVAAEHRSCWFVSAHQHQEQPPPQQQHRSFSSLLGHSPMGGSAATLVDSTTMHIPTKEEAEIGGVWIKESAKRDKLLELKSELASESTDNAVPDLRHAATQVQKQDLWLAEGLQLLARQTELPATAVAANTNDNDSSAILLQKVLQSIEERQRTTEHTEQQDAADPPEELHQVQWEEFLQNVSSELQQSLSSLPPGRCLMPVRDYYDASSELLELNKSSNGPQVDTTAVKEWIEEQRQQQQQQQSPLAQSFHEAVTRARLQTTLSLTDHLHASWAIWTKLTDADVDRAAVRHHHHVQDEDDSATTMPRDKLVAVLRAFLVGSGTDRVDALWRLMDKDDDGLLEQEEVQHVVNAAIAPVQSAFQRLLEDALEAAVSSPSSAPQSPSSSSSSSDPPQPVAIGWRQRRREARHRKWLRRLFQSKAVKRHFADDLQQAHRLRCIYAWANKAHQNNKTDSVLVEEDNDGSSGSIATTLAGRKRYVELPPKISLSEFRQVQAIHFPQLDGVGSELLESFRDDLFVEQGKGRQRRELLRDGALFFTGLCVLDYVILSL